MLLFTIVPEKSYGNEKLQRLHTEVRKTDNAFRQAKAEGEPWDQIRALCEVHIAASYKYQKARWGKIRCRLHPAHLMR